MKKNIRRLPFALVAWSAFLFSCAAASLAHGPSGTLSERGYQEMRRLAHELDEVAYHANDQAEHQQAWIYNNDRTFLRAVARFASHAEAFHARMDTYRTRPWQVDDELRSLIRDARDVRYRAEHARYADRHTIADWSRVESLLNQMIRVYQADVDHRSWESGEDYGPRYGAPPPGAPRSYAPAHPGGGADRGNLSALARELVDRTGRIYNLATSAAGPFVIAEPRQRAALDAILRFREQSQVFQQRLESGLDPSRLAVIADHLAQDAREADSLLQQTTYEPQLRGDWQEAMRLVGQIQSIAAPR